MQCRQRLDLIHEHPAYPHMLKVLQALGRGGHQAVLAGGSVRDALLGRSPKDFDIATSAAPDEVERLFPATLAVGKAFGTIVVVEHGFNFEVTTFRTEGKYLDGRRPERVHFSDMSADAERRDFTVNAIFYDPVRETLFDSQGGIKDLLGKTLRTVGQPELRFAEDHLRMLRAARFVAQLGFALEPRTRAAIKQLHTKLATISSERVLHELQRLLMGPYALDGLCALQETQLCQVVWPELTDFDVRQLRSFGLFASWEVAFSAVTLLLNVDPGPRLRAWKVSRESQKKIKAQLEGARRLLDPKSSRAMRILILGGEEFAAILLLAEGWLAVKRDAPRVRDWIDEYLSAVGPSGVLPRPFLTGEDLLKQGVSPSEQMGRFLRQLYEAQLEGLVRSRHQAFELLSKLQG